jgi:hypothetical protein
MARRTNLVYNPTFQITSAGSTTIPDGWSAVSSTIEKSSVYGFYGASSLKVTKTAVPRSGVISFLGINVTAAKSYVASCYVRIPTDGQDAPLIISIRWYTTAGIEIIGTATSDVRTVSYTEDWVRLYVIGVAPATAITAKIYVSQPTIGTAGQVFFLDSVMLEQSTFLGNYVDNFTQAQETAITSNALAPVQPPTIGGMFLNADVALGNLVFNTIDENSVVWVCRDIDGWWGHPEAQVPDITRGTQDGSYEVEGRYAARVLTLTGVFIPKNSADISVARDALVSATNLARTGAWLKTSEEPTKASYVRLAGRPQIITVNARGRTEFSIPLRAADPIKYLWNDDNLDGLTEVDISGTQIYAGAPNSGTATVAPKFQITGPLGTGSTIYNAKTDKTITIASPLRGARRVAAVNTSQVFNQKVTLTTIEKHNIIVGDIIDVSNAGQYSSSTSTPYTVTAVTTTAPFSVSYVAFINDTAEVSQLGAYISLRYNDTLLVDSYERSVSLNGNTSGNRATLDTLIDWIDLIPGDNPLEFTDNIDPSYATNKTYVVATQQATIETSSAHFLEVGEQIVVSLDADATLRRKVLTSNVATLTTSTPHGFSVGDQVDVKITVSAVVDKKQVVSSVGILTVTPVADGSAFVSGDIINVALSTVAVVATKARSGDTITIGTSAPHGFSTLDSVSVTLPVNSTISTKSVTSNVVQLVTPATHGYSVGDSVVVTLPLSTTVVDKTISGTFVTMTTSSAHGFSALDVATIALATSATMSGTRSFAGSAGDYVVSLTTSSAHNYNVGDIVAVNLNIPTSGTVTNRAATATACTLTLSATHNYSVGEQITVSGVSTRYNGTYIISAVNAGTNTLTYAFSGTTESSIASSGTVINNTIKDGYNGTKVISTTPSGTSLTYLYYGHDNATSSTLFGASKTLTNTTNTQLNGDYPVTIVNTTRFSYTKAGV